MIKNKVNREVEYYEDYEHLLVRPGMYIGSVDLVEDKIPIINDQNLLTLKEKTFSNGFYRLIDEVLDNAFDEAKRCHTEGNPMKSISVYFYPEDNRIKIQDTGKGFHNGLDIDKKTKSMRIENAFTKLRAGSNFKTEDEETKTAGRNGIGVSATNILSDYFKVKSINENFSYECVWEKFVEDKKSKVIKKGSYKKTVTEVEFIPRKEIFKGSKLDFDIIKTRLFFRYVNLNKSGIFKDFSFNVYWNDKLLDFSKIDIFRKNSIELKLNKQLSVVLWNNFPNSTSVSFVNDSFCSGFHTKYICEFINSKLFGNDKANSFYNYFISLNIPTKYVDFEDQVKTKFTITRATLDKILPLTLTAKQIKDINKTDFYMRVKFDIEDSEKDANEKLLKKAKKETSKVKISTKYHPSSTKDTIFLTEGDSANGSLLQERDVKLHSTYALKGKPKNASSLTDLITNKELSELISILDLKLEDRGKSCPFKRIIIANDSDCLEENTLVVTSSGNKKIRDVVPGDKVLTHTNNYKKVENIIKTY